jgi:hypothetical protein
MRLAGWLSILIMAAAFGLAAGAAVEEVSRVEEAAPVAEQPAAASRQQPAAAAPPAERPVPEELQDAVARAAAIKGAAPLPIGTMSELMIDLIYPTSDAILYISSRTPTNDVEWNELRAKALILAESANLLMTPPRAMDNGRWMQDAQLMLDAGAAAFEAAKNRDLEALENLNQAVYESCVVCHFHYRPDYGKPKTP